MNPPTALAAALLVGCTSPGSHGGTGSNGDSGSDSGGAASTGGASSADARPDGPGDASGPSACSDDAGGLPADAVCVLTVEGRVVDEHGAPAPAGLSVSACGPTQCNPGLTGEDARFRIDVGLHIVPSIYAVQVHVRPDETSFYFPLLRSMPAAPHIDVGDLRQFPLPATGPALQIDRAGTPAQSVTSGEVTLEVPAATYVRLDVESNLAKAHGREFRTLRIPSAVQAEFADPGLGVVALYAVEPFECSFEQGGSPNQLVKARLSFANTGGLAAGAAVDVLALGSYVFSDWLPIGTFTRVAGAHVSSDGSRIDMDPGEGTSYLTWFGVRAAQ